MTEKEITLLGFEKEEIIEFYSENVNYYYHFKVVNGFEFISCSNKDAIYGDWFVEIFNTEPSIRFYNFAEVQGLINLLNKRKK